MRQLIRSQTIPDIPAENEAGRKYIPGGRRTVSLILVMLMLLFSRVFPLIPLYDIKEGEILKTQIQVGRRVVPATFRED